MPIKAVVFLAITSKNDEPVPPSFEYDGFFSVLTADFGDFFSLGGGEGISSSSSIGSGA